MIGVYYSIKGPKIGLVIVLAFRRGVWDDTMPAGCCSKKEFVA